MHDAVVYTCTLTEYDLHEHVDCKVGLREYSQSKKGRCYTYLEVRLSENGEMESELKQRIGLAATGVCEK